MGTTFELVDCTVFPVEDADGREVVRLPSEDVVILVVSDEEEGVLKIQGRSNDGPAVY